MQIIGIDPGETTGVAIYSTDEMNSDVILRGKQTDRRTKLPPELANWAYEAEYYKYWQFPTNSPAEYWNFAQWLAHTATAFDMMKDVTYVCEKFEWRKPDFNQDIARGYQQTKISYVPAEVVGIVKVQCYGLRVNLVMQSASQATGHSEGNKGAFWDDEKLAKLGVYKPNMKHAMDALRHILYYRTFTLQDQDFLRRLK